jgi:hypothetical protein
MPLYHMFFKLINKLFHGTTREYIWQSLFEIGRAIVSSDLRKENEVLQIIKEWWEIRRSPALLPLALEAIECFYDISSDKKVFQDIWFDAIGLVGLGIGSLTHTDVELWRSIGLRIGLSASDVDGLLPEKAVEKTRKDIIAEAALKRIAIVSLREKQAQEARDIIQKETKAEVFCVDEVVAGYETKKALSADVILFVWSSAKHAVYRAFDGVDRNKIAYVQGTGASSIVRSLERWIIKKGN